MTDDKEKADILFLSDTQAPMFVERLVLRTHQNTKATTTIFAQILRVRPPVLYWLGDIVSLGFRDNKWPIIDRFLEKCRQAGTSVYAIMGNHDVMGRPRKGARNFQQRFPEHVHTGYVQKTDDIAVVMLNSNFSTLSVADLVKQQTWYEQTLADLDADPAVRVVIVTCHHAPYSNSKLVGSSKLVQQRFVPNYLKSQKGRLFITGHSHAFERYEFEGKTFLVIGGGGGLRQPLNTSLSRLPDLATEYKPMFHYLAVRREGDGLVLTSYCLKADFSGFDIGYTFTV
ncbi:metallophosphoesterase family protein [Spirosoma utsteinense]|uniref:UDP-2,3-diacylglucosamine pyrophosphatase LpxH n=1 Tax=Spirosoma utsteinense TaxID=2585773 RepID=A0ABR6W0E3_9BACT|nr:metallophosphoesterase [Spirosoma utsteinense]MBC3783775.1 UDP-2,3-diacylglucosamine pyrophosphatase LpxH [Spirosoma utsteinense]MBC3790081.1 UDP-2,3-diacylglucosamine pyrophosphatase LpxH [Spirosoma utsteinense]